LVWRARTVSCKKRRLEQNLGGLRGYYTGGKNIKETEGIRKKGAGRGRSGVNTPLKSH